MTSALSDWASEFLREDRVVVVGTLNADGSPHLTMIKAAIRQVDDSV